MAPTRKSREQPYELLFNRAARTAKEIPMKRKHTVDMRTEVQAWWKQCQERMLYYKCQCAPLVLDIKGFLHAFRGQEEDARVEVDAYMGYCGQERTFTSSSDDDSCRIRLSKRMQKWT